MNVRYVRATSNLSIRSLFQLMDWPIPFCSQLVRHSFSLSHVHSTQMQQAKEIHVYFYSFSLRNNKKIKKSSSQHFSKSVFIMLLSLSHILNTFFNFSFLFQIDLMNETNFELKHMKKCPICINDCHILSNSVHTFTHV